MLAVQLALLLLLPAAPALAATIPVTVVGKSSTQIVISYTASTTGACLVAASESPSYTPLVTDVNPNLFTDSNRDDRAGALTGGTGRIFVIGKRAMERAPSDSKWYSRALQANTTHYVRVTCGGDTGTASVTTSNIPMGMTRGDIPPVASPADGTYLLPTFSPTDRAQTTTDPLTGALVRRVTLPGDRAGQPWYGLTSAGNHTLCSPALSAAGFWRCVVSTGGGESRALYAIHPATGEVRFTGLLTFYGQAWGLREGVHFCSPGGGGSWMWHPTDPNVFYCGTYDSQNRMVLTEVALDTGAGKTGSDAAKAQDTAVDVAMLTVLTPAPGTVAALMAAYDSSFDSTRFNCLAEAVQLNYILISCRRGAQDSYAWVAVYDVDARAIVAALRQWADPRSRWCSLHGFYDAGHVPIAIVGNGNLKGVGTGDGAYVTSLNSHMTGTDATTSITVSSDCRGTPGCLAGDPVSPQPDTWLMPAHVGDIVAVHGPGSAGLEHMQIQSCGGASAGSCAGKTTWVLVRGLAGTASYTHSPGDSIQMVCGAGQFGGSPLRTTEMNWDFVGAPRGNSALHYATRSPFESSHSIYRGTAAGRKMWVTTGYAAVFGDLRDPATWDASSSIAYDEAPAFAGHVGPAFGQQASRHPSYRNEHASSPENEWFVDFTTWNGAAFTTPCSPVEPNLYKCNYGGPDGGTLARRQLPTVAMSGTRGLADISGPASRITSAPADQFKYCVALVAGECRSSSDAGGVSKAGDIYINAPGVTLTSCGMADLGSSPDLCVGDAPMQVPALLQVRALSGMTAAQSGGQTRALSRVFATALRGTTRNALPTPDGAWILLEPGPAPGQIVMIKNPGLPAADGVDRTRFVPVTIPVPAPTTSGASRAHVEFGYAEEGTVDQFFCTSRREACVAASTALSEEMPFRYKTSEAYSGLACSSGCSIVLPLIPQRIAYWTVRYLDSSNNVVASGPQGVATESGAQAVSGGAASTGGKKPPKRPPRTSRFGTRNQAAGTTSAETGSVTPLALERSGGGDAMTQAPLSSEQGAAVAFVAPAPGGSPRGQDLASVARGTSFPFVDVNNNGTHDPGVDSDDITPALLTGHFSTAESIVIPENVSALSQGSLTGLTLTAAKNVTIRSGISAGAAGITVRAGGRIDVGDGQRLQAGFVRLEAEADLRVGRGAVVETSGGSAASRGVVHLASLGGDVHVMESARISADSDVVMTARRGSVAVRAASRLVAPAAVIFIDAGATIVTEHSQLHSQALGIQAQGSGISLRDNLVRVAPGQGWVWIVAPAPGAVIDLSHTLWENVTAQMLRLDADLLVDE